MQYNFILVESAVAENVGASARALKNMDLVIGTTAKKRRIHADHYLCSEIPGLLERKAAMLEIVAIVFVREESGWFRQKLKKPVTRRPDPASPAIAAQFKDTPEFRHLRKITCDLLIRAGYDKISPVYSRIMGRLEAMGDKETRLLMSVCSKFEL